ncbi:DUF6882 domain-containing protein [Spirosoma foliorum]|uniref:Uncharacterized protein n=1 Tax=Spirosoma foliorum TaxID=2710596 RepID=A0A7G5GYE1_9BACT|nr:DUF6882 domain-containing protein [Spirosoma foliorum]QMW03883.1 hypothetical protein H3H32_02695 [Spirosoma foliorum]
MSFFKNLFGKSESAKPQSEPTTKPISVTFPPAQTEDELFAQYGALGFEKQADVPTVVGNNSWGVDMNSGTITFGSSLRFPIQVLGTISHSSNTWLWAWANEKSGIPANLLEQANQLKKYGETNGIDLLQVSQFDADINDLHKIGCIASGMLDSSCYYIADYGKGAMLVTIKAKEFEAVQKNTHFLMITTFPQLISNFNVDHRAAFTNYLQAKGYTVSETVNQVRGQNGSDSLVGEFDEQSRLTNITS